MTDKILDYLAIVTASAAATCIVLSFLFILFFAWKYFLIISFFILSVWACSRCETIWRGRLR